MYRCFRRVWDTVAALLGFISTKAGGEGETALAIHFPHKFWRLAAIFFSRRVNAVPLQIKRTRTWEMWRGCWQQSATHLWIQSTGFSLEREEIHNCSCRRFCCLPFSPLSDQREWSRLHFYGANMMHGRWWWYWHLSLSLFAKCSPTDDVDTGLEISVGALRSPKRRSYMRRRFTNRIVWLLTFF